MAGLSTENNMWLINRSYKANQGWTTTCPTKDVSDKLLELEQKTIDGLVREEKMAVVISQLQEQLHELTK